MTKQKNNFLSIKNFLFKPILSKNASSQLKLAYKHQIQPNNTKTETRSKTSKTDKNHRKPLMSDFHDLIATENLFNKKNCFSQELSKMLTNNHAKIADITKTAKKHKTETRSKASKNAKSTENRFEVILVSNKVNIFNRKVFLPKLSYNLSNHLKLAQNGPTRPNRTKTKTCQKRPKLHKNDFCNL